MENEMITVKEVAKYLRLSLPTVYRLVNAGTIPHVKIGCRYIIPRTDFLSWVESNVPGGKTDGKKTRIM